MTARAGTALFFALLALGACAQDNAGFPPGALEVRVVEVYPHDPRAFTQGLAVHDGYLFESTGHYGQSSLRKVEIESGAVEAIRPIDATFFAEGATIIDGLIYQLTWQNGVGFVWRVDDFAPVGRFRYEGEGWGLTHDGEHLIMSDGTATLRFLDPDLDGEALEVVRTVVVRDGGRPVTQLNELEYIAGEVWANVWYDERIARIDPESGAVLGWIAVGHLYPAARRATRDDVLNGIAYDASTGRLFVTGKNWPVLFEIEVDE